MPGKVMHVHFVLQSLFCQVKLLSGLTCFIIFDIDMFVLKLNITGFISLFV